VLLVSLLTTVLVYSTAGDRLAGNQVCLAKERHMFSIRLVFREGFKNDSVTVRINGKEVKPEGALTTRTDVEPPLAWSVDIPLDTESALIQVSVPTRNISESITLDLTQFAQLDIALAGNRIELRPFRDVVPSIG
jgi:hypothetical protein